MERSPTSVLTGKVRLSFANIWQAKKFDDSDGDAKYSTVVLVDKNDTATVNAIFAAQEAAMQAGITTLWKGKKPAGLKMPIHDGDDKDDAAYQGHYYFTASSKNKPGIIGLDKKEIDDPTEVYSGCYCRLTLNFFPFDVKSKGVACGLNNIMKVADGEAFAGRRSAQDDFADIDGLEEFDANEADKEDMSFL